MIAKEGVTRYRNNIDSLGSMGPRSRGDDIGGVARSRTAEGRPDIRARIHPRRTQRAGSPEAGDGDGRVAEQTLRRPEAGCVYVTEIPARQMAEYGHVLPEPGDEQMWLDGLPAEDRAYMQGVGMREAASANSYLKATGDARIALFPRLGF